MPWGPIWLLEALKIDKMIKIINQSMMAVKRHHDDGINVITTVNTTDPLLLYQLTVQILSLP